MADLTVFNSKEEYESLAERKTGSEEVFSGHLLHVYSDDVTLPDGAPSKRELIRHLGAVAILPLTDDGYVYMERQFRYPLDAVITEVPAGKLNTKTEDRLEAAKRELQEETGLTADEWTNLGDFHPSAAYTDERLTLYLARGLHEGAQKLDDDEFLNVYKVPFATVLDEVLAGKITDAKTQIIILKAAAVIGEFRRKGTV